MDVTATRVALDAAIQAHLTPKIRGYPFLTNKPQVPCYMIGFQRIKFHETFEGKESSQIVVQLLVNPVDLEAAVRQLDAWLAPSGAASMVAAIDSVSWATVDRMEGDYQRVSLLKDGTEYLSCRIYANVLDGV